MESEKIIHTYTQPWEQRKKMKRDKGRLGSSLCCSGILIIQLCILDWKPFKTSTSLLASQLGNQHAVGKDHTSIMQALINYLD